MAGLSEQEEFELLSLEREKAMSSASPVAMNTDTFTVPSRPRQFVSPVDQPARMINPKIGERQVPVENPLDRGIYQAGGNVTDILANAGLPAEVAAGGGYLANLGLQLGSTFLGGGAGAKLEPAMQRAGEFVMKKALNPTPLQVESGVADRAAKTMLREGKWVTRPDVEEMTNDITKINAQIMDMIKNSPETINKTRVAMGAGKAYAKWSNQVANAADVGAVKQAVKEFLENPAIAENMSALAAQRLKQGTYRALGERAYQPGAAGVTAGMDAEKGMAFALKEELAAKHPALLSELNKRESALLEARKLAEKALAKSDARQVAGMGFLAKNPAAAAGWMAERSPFVKSLLAKYLHDYADPEMAGRIAGASLGAQSGNPPRQ